MSLITEFTDDLLHRFFSRIDMEGDCWEWLGYKSKKGYGQIRNLSKTEATHRITLAIHGYIFKKGDVVDHKCRNKGCVNPKHLRIVDNKTNTLENSKSLPALNLLKTYCKHGHILKGDNLKLYTNPNTGKEYRVCTLCAKIRDKRRGTNGFK